MGRSKNQQLPLPPVWTPPGELWAIVEPMMINLELPKPGGRNWIDQRAAFDAVIFRLRTGCRWYHLPKHDPDDNSVHRTFQS